MAYLHPNAETGQRQDHGQNQEGVLLKFVQDELVPKLTLEKYWMNGRQIRNCIRAAIAIATKKGRALEKTDIEDVVLLGSKF